MKEELRIDQLRKVEYWNDVSRAYGDIAAYMMNLFAKKAIEFAEIKTDSKVLDVACGTGIVSLQLSKNVSTITAVDYSEKMLEQFTASIQERKIKNIRLIHSDGQNLPLDDNQFDAAFSMFGLMFFPDRLQGFRELYRVLKPDSKVVVSSWAPKEKSNLIEHLEQAVRISLPDMPSSREDFPLENPYEFENEMTAAGFDEVKIHEITCALPAIRPEALWDMMSNGGALKFMKEKLDAAKWKEVEKNALDYLRQKLVMENIHMNNTAYIGVGVKPNLIKSSINKKFISKSSISINAPVPSVWDALINPAIIKKYFFGAEVISDWEEGRPITFKGEWNGNKYEEKGIILQIKPNKVLQYTHWSNLEGLPDLPEHYRTWTFTLSEDRDGVQLFVFEENIPTEKQKVRSDEFWAGVLSAIKNILET